MTAAMIGKSVSHYDIVEKLGEGGMGAVYKAHDRRLDRTVALKFLPPHLARSLEDRDRFLLEAKATSALNHPNILTVYDLGEAEGQFFIVSEFVDGRTLRRMLEQGRIPLEQVLEFALAIADGLSHAHARGILHRDIKPENVMVTPESRVKIMDFGLARPLSSDDRLTHPGMLMGTARYMSPEQIEGKAVDRRSDIFAFGSLLYELIGGRSPFEGEYEVAVLYAVVNAEPAPLDELNPAVPAPLVRLIARCMEKSPTKRFVSFDEIVPLLQSLQREMSSALEGASALLAKNAPILPSAILPEGLLIGREGESEALRQALSAVRAGTGRAIFVKGESGIGKTTVVSAAAREAHARGMHVLWGRSLFQEPGLPYHPYATAFRAAFPHAGNTLLDALAEDAEARGLRLAGRLPLIRSFLGFTPGTPDVMDKEQLWDAVLALLGILNRDAGVMLILEDLQWADRSSIGLLAFLARNIARSRVLLVGVYRPVISGEEPGVDVAVLNECVRQLRIEGMAQEIEISRLPLSESRAVAKHLLAGSAADSELVEKICQASDGNPLFLVELVKLLKTGEISSALKEGNTANGDREIILSERVNDVILQRISRLSDSDREILEIGSCDGLTFTSEVVLACLRTERLPLLKRLQVLEKALGLIRQEGRRYRFDHPLIRQVLYAGILPELREEYHSTIAAWLIEHHRDDAQIAASVAHHLLASNQSERAVEFLLRAAEQAGRLCAFEDAEAQYLKAHRILTAVRPEPTGQLLRAEEGLGDVARSSGKPANALAHYRQALEYSRDGSDAASRSATLRKSGDCLRIMGDIPAARSLCAEALALLQGTDDVRERLECMHSLTAIDMAKGEYAQAITVSREALDEARRLQDSRHIALSLCDLGGAQFHHGEYAPAVSSLEEAKTLQEFHGDLRGLAGTLNFLAHAYHRLARLGDALDAAFRSLETKERIADTTAIPGSLNIIGDVYRDGGDPEKAITYHSRSLALARMHGNRGSECDNVRDLGVDHLMLGELEKADALLTEVLALAEKYDFGWYITRTCISLGEMHMCRGLTTEALAFSRRGLELAQKIHAGELVIEALWKRALVLRRAGSAGEGLSLLEDAVQSAEASGYRLFLWRMYQDLALFYAEAARSTEAQEALQRARSCADAVAAKAGQRGIRESFLNLAEVRQLLGEQ